MPSAEHIESPDYLGQYLDGANQFRRLTPEEEIALSQAVLAGVAEQVRVQHAADTEAAPFQATIDPEVQRRIDEGERAKNSLIESNLLLVASIAGRYKRPPGMSVMELICEGNLGLQRAAIKYDWQKGTRFSTYAPWWIKKYVRRHLARGLIVLPEADSQALTEAWSSDDPAPTTYPEVAQRAHGARYPLSLDADFEADAQGDPFSSRLYDGLEGNCTEDEEATIGRIVTREVLETALQGFRAAADVVRIVEMRVGLNGYPIDMPFHIIAEELGIPARSASRYFQRAIKILKNDPKVLQLLMGE